MINAIKQSYDRLIFFREVFMKKGIVVGLLSTLGLIVFAMVGIPHYNVWQQNMRGQAELARAEYNKRILVVEAEMNLEVERFNALAEVERARGAAEAMGVIRDSGYLNELYILYRWVLDIHQNAQIIYVPTEGMLPILEAGRFR